MGGSARVLGYDQNSGRQCRRYVRRNRADATERLEGIKHALSCKIPSLILPRNFISDPNFVTPWMNEFTVHVFPAVKHKNVATCYVKTNSIYRQVFCVVDIDFLFYLIRSKISFILWLRWSNISISSHVGKICNIYHFACLTVDFKSWTCWDTQNYIWRSSL